MSNHIRINRSYDAYRMGQPREAIRSHIGIRYIRAQSDLIGAPEPMSIETVLAAPNGGSVSVLPDLLRHST